MELLKLTRPEIAEYRKHLLELTKSLENIERELSEKFDAEDLEEFTEGGDDPISNLIAAVECAREAYGDINAESDWIEVQE